MNRTRRLGWLLALGTVAALLAQVPAGALPPGSPKVGLVCTPGTVSGSTHSFNLVANAGHIQTPDGNHILMWSYAVAAAADPTDLWPNFQSPGPVPQARALSAATPLVVSAVSQLCQLSPPAVSRLNT